MLLNGDQWICSLRTIWLAALLFGSSVSSAFDQHPLKIQHNASSPIIEALYRAPNSVTTPWHLCVVLPNVSDAYWDPIKAGVLFETKRLGVTASIHEARGYSEEGVNQQRQVLKSRCQPSRAHAIVLAAIDGNAFFEVASVFKERNIPIIDLINGLPSGLATSRIQVDHLGGGEVLGKDVLAYLETLRTQVRNRQLRVLWVPGPLIAQWSKDTDYGFKTALSSTRHLTIDTFYLEPHFREQEVELRKQLENGQHYDVIVGTGVTAMAAVSLKRKGILNADTHIFSTYTSAEIIELIERGDVENAVTDDPYLLGRLGVAVAVAALEGGEVPRIIGTQSTLVKSTTQEDETSAPEAD